MAEYFCKRSTTNINRSRMALFGPFISGQNLPPGTLPKPVNFSLANGTTARCELESGKRYVAFLQFYGDRGGTFKLSIQPVDQSSPETQLFSVSIPESLAGSPGQLGHAFTTFVPFTMN